MKPRTRILIISTIALATAAVAIALTFISATTPITFDTPLPTPDSPLPTPDIDQWWSVCPGDPGCPDAWPVQPTYTPQALPTCLPTPTCPDIGASPTPYPTATPYPLQPTFPPPITLPTPTPTPTPIRPTPTPPPSGTTYYIDATDGDDTNTGTEPQAAWRTLPRVSAQFAAGAFLPGDRILFERGKTWTIDADSRLVIAGSSGEAGNPIYVGAYGSGDPPLFDAAGNEVKVIVHRAWWNDADYITIEDLEITGVHDTGAVYLEDVRHWTLRNLNIHDVTAEDGGWAAAIRIRRASEHIRVENCTIARIQGEGIYLGTSETPGDHTKHVTITGCDISYCDAEAVDFKDDTERCSLEHSNLTMNGSDPSLDHTQISLGGQYNRVTSCTISGTRDGNRSAISLGRYSGGEVTDSGHHNTVENCTITGATGLYGAIYLVGQGNRITGCTIADSTYAVYGANTDTGLHTIEHNTFTNISTYPIYLSDHQSYYAFDYNRYDQSNAVWYESGASRDWAYVQALGQETNGTAKSTETPTATPSGSVYYADPGDNLTAIVSGMQSGDILILRDGTYHTDLTIGTAGITVQAEHDGQATIDGDGIRDALWVQAGANDVTVTGIVFRNALGTVIIINGDRTMLRRVSAYDSGSGNSHTVIVSHAQDALLEDCAASGRGRNNFLIYESNNVTLRRCWARWMETSGSSTAQTTIQVYASDNTLIENCVATNGSDVLNVSAMNFWAADWNVEAGHPSCSNNTVFASVFHGFDVYHQVWHGHYSAPGLVTTQENNVLDNVAFPNAQSDALVFQRGGHNLTLRNITGVGGRGLVVDNLYEDNPTAILRNSMFYHADNAIRVNAPGEVAVDHAYNAIYDVTLPFWNEEQGPGEIFDIEPSYDVTTYGLGAYLIRPANLAGLGEGGTDVGAEVLYQTVDGSVTAIPLWPWPMEARICAETQQSVTYESHDGCTGGLWATLDGVY